ncbi:MAG: hypothetical protein RL033_4507 [Pseudomonadota bacterium]
MENDKSMHIGAEFTLPLSRAEFRHALGTGLGRAQLHVERFGAQSVRDEILEAATTSKVYDPQVDGLRSAWLAELCVQSDLVQVVTERRATGSDWDRALRCELLKQFALRGHESARVALCAACKRWKNDFTRDYACRELVDLDGAKGLVFAARRLGRLRIPAGVAPTASQRVQGPRQREAVQDVVGAISFAKTSLHWLRRWGRDASEEELEAVFALATPSAAAIVLENVFRCLSEAKRPPIEPWVFELLEHRDVNVRRCCAGALSHHVQPRVRAAGLAALQVDLPLALTLLRENAIQEDIEAMVGALRPVADRDAEHEVVCGLNELLRDNGRVRAPALASYVYERSPCMECRQKAVEVLEAQGLTPPWLRVECSRDASERVRKIFAKMDNPT